MNDLAESSGLGERVRFLQRPDVWPDAPHAVRAVEAHLSWVFLTRQFAFKLKKPVRVMGQDLRSVRSRLKSARTESELNRRLAPEVYLGYLPLVVRPSGELALQGHGEPVDWLVWMRRLPEQDLLDVAVGENTATVERLRPAAIQLARFYAQAEPERLSAAEYRAKLAAAVAQNRRALRKAGRALPQDRVGEVQHAQESWLAAEHDLIGQRAGRVVEGHGDLRPEHVYLGTPPAFIDCLEFDRELRLLDPVDEIAFLGLASRTIGAPQVDPVFLTSYADLTGDVPPPELVAFYGILRACTRARLAAARSVERGQDAEKARQTATRWLQLAADEIPHLRLVSG